MVTAPRREFIKAFATGRATISDVLAAARSLMSEGCDEPPDRCGCPEQRMTPLEFAQWLESSVHKAQRAPVRLDQRENLEAGQRQRRQLEAVAS
jgi:hypothetical protein